VKNEADRRKYLDQINEKESIELEPEKILKNPGKRQNSKLILNSFWGKVHLK